MAFVGRGSLPANYEDLRSRVTQNLVLPQPQPQFLFAHWAMAGRLSLAALNAGANTTQQYVTAAGGGAPVSQELDRMARVADAYPGFAVSVDAFGKDEGDTIKFQRPVFAAGDLTEAARELKPDATISTTGRAVQAEEVPVVLKEYHGPSAADSAGVAPFAIRNFDSKYRANKLSVTQLVTKHLTYDYTYWLDVVIRDKMRQSGYTTLANANLTDASSFTAGGGQVFNVEAVLRARKALSDRNWPKFPNGRYVMLVPTTFNTDMVQDVDYRELSKSHEDGRNLLYGYIGSIQDVDIFECSTLKQYAAASVVPGDLTGTVATGVTLEEAIMFGPGSLAFGTATSEQQGAVGPELRFADDTNYGTVAKCIWYALHCFQNLDVRGSQRLLAQST